MNAFREDLQSRFTSVSKRSETAQLETDFVSGAKDRLRAEQTLKAFNTAREKLVVEESRYQRGKAGILTGYLKSPAHAKAAKTFLQAKEDLLEINPTVGQKLENNAHDVINAAMDKKFATRSPANKGLKR